MQVRKSKELVQDWAENHISMVSRRLADQIDQRSAEVLPRLKKVLDAFKAEQIGMHHFSSVSGSGLSDPGREAIDRVFAKVLGADSAAVRLQFVSGTHAISSVLFGVLRPGDNLLSLTGRPYDTLEEVIGLRGSGQGSLQDFGIFYDEIDLTKNGALNFSILEHSLETPRKMVFIQRSCGYSWRTSLSIDLIEQICSFVHQKQPECICFVDNCYGELVEGKEPTEVGADVIAGSLIKNLGGTIVPTGGYVAGRIDLVEQACFRLTAPGIGMVSGTTFGLNRLVLQGLFLAPQMVSEALIGADLVAGVFDELGFLVHPSIGEKRGDVIQAVRLGSPEALQLVCSALQKCSPIGSYLQPQPAAMAGYESHLVMAGGTFIDGSTSELSADAPLRKPYNLFVQGGTHRAHIKIALQQALCDLVECGFLDLTQT